MNKVILFLTLFGISFSALSAHVKFEPGEPILAQLTIGSERMLQFPEPVAFGARDHYDSIFRYDIIDSTLYITALEAFRERLIFRGIASSQIYVVDAIASDVDAPPRLVIHVVNDDEQVHSNVNRTTRGTITPVDLFQFASQSLFAPDVSLIEPLEGVRRVTVSQNELNNFYRGGALKARPYASWSAGGRYVTAVQLTNVTSSIVRFEPCLVRGRFEIASQQSSAAAPAGSVRDTLMAYFITSEPFHVAVTRNEGFPCR